MADSARLTITKNLQTALQAMTVAGGYNYDVISGSVTLDPTVNILTINGVDLPFYQIEIGTDGSKEYFPANQLREVINYTIMARYDSTDIIDQVARVTIWENLIADIEKALTVDITRGANAVDTRLGVAEPFVGVGSAIVIVLQPITVRLHRTYGVA